MQLVDDELAVELGLAASLVDIQLVHLVDTVVAAVDMDSDKLDLVHRSSSLAVVHFVDTYFANEDHTWVGFQTEEDILLVDVSSLVASHDKLEVQHSVHILVDHMVTL